MDASGAPTDWYHAFTSFAPTLPFQLASGGNEPVEQVRVPQFVGLNSTQASTQAEALGLVLTPTGVASSAEPEGTVLAQDPDHVAGRQVARL